MIMNDSCKECIRSKQIKKSKEFSDINMRECYINEVNKIIEEHAGSCSTPEVSEIISRYYEKLTGKKESYKGAKHKYNLLLLKREEEIIKEIEISKNPLEECIKYVCAANYIDFSAVANVNENTFFSLMQKAKEQEIDKTEFKYFIQDLEKAKTLLYITDNCGEIVLDKIFIKFINDLYPGIDITVMLRGKNTINDATIEDAKEIGLDKTARCIGNGNGAPGTVIKELSPEAKKIITSADVIIAKGQGNFESMFGEGLNPYYMFLCKCGLFTKRFGIEKFSSVFRKEERIKNLKI